MIYKLFNNWPWHRKQAIRMDPLTIRTITYKQWSYSVVYWMHISVECRGFDMIWVWPDYLGYFNKGLSTRWHDSFSLFLLFFFVLLKIYNLHTVAEYTITEVSQFTSWFLVLLTILLMSWHFKLCFSFRPFKEHIETLCWDVEGWCLIPEAMIKGFGDREGVGD